MFASLSKKSWDDISHFKKENKVQLMALVIPFTFLFGFDGSPFKNYRSIHQYTWTRCFWVWLSYWMKKMKRNKANKIRNWTEMKHAFFHKGPIKAGSGMSETWRGTEQSSNINCTPNLPSAKHMNYTLPVNIFVQNCMIHVCMDDWDGSLSHLLL